MYFQLRSSLTHTSLLFENDKGQQMYTFAIYLVSLQVINKLMCIFYYYGLDKLLVM